MLTAYALAFCRAMIGLVFLASFASKAPNVRALEATIAGFAVLPSRWSRPVSICFLVGEITVTILMAVGGRFLTFGFALAVTLLLVFTGALGLVLARRLRVSCSCFGPSSRLVSTYDMCRNLGFIVCASAGLVTSALDPGDLYWAQWLLTGLVATVVVVVWINLRDIAQIFR